MFWKGTIRGSYQPFFPSDQLGFGIHYTDHMFIMDYSDEKGW